MEEYNRLKLLRKTESSENIFTEVLNSIEKYPDSAELNYLAASICDAERTEKEAVSFYLKAFDLNLSGQLRRDAYLGLASTYRSLGEYQKSKEIFEKAIQEFPNYRPYYVFLALTENNLGNSDVAIKHLLDQLIETSKDEDICSYHRALKFYSTRLHEVFE